MSVRRGVFIAAVVLATASTPLFFTASQGDNGRGVPSSRCSPALVALVPQGATIQDCVMLGGPYLQY